MIVLYALGMDLKTIWEVMESIGADPKQIRRDLKHVRNALTPGTDPYRVLLFTLALVTMEEKYQNMANGEVILFKEALEVWCEIDKVITGSIWALHALLIEHEIGLGEGVAPDFFVHEVFKVFLDPTTDLEDLPGDEDEFDDFIVSAVVKFVNALITPENVNDREVDNSPFGGKGWGAAEGEG